MYNDFILLENTVIFSAT